jgi:DnaT-like ssDNA binding protein
MPLSTTPGAADANSYADLDEARVYIASRFPTVADPGDEILTGWLIAGTRELDACFDWTGQATTPDTQALDWPRLGMLNKRGGVIASDVIPTPLKNAAIEFGLQLGSSDRLSDNDTLKKGIIGVKAGSVDVRFSDVQGGKAASYEGGEVLLRKEQTDLRYAADIVPGEVRRLLVPGWYEEADIQGNIIFGTM